MEEVYSIYSFTNIIILGFITIGKMPFPTPIDEVVNLEMFNFDKKKKEIER
jgi:hypothetical protein